MKRFEYAQPRSEREAVELLTDGEKQTAILAGGTDLVALMKRMVVTPDRVVNIREIDSLRRIDTDHDGNVWIGAAVSLEEFLDDPATDPFPSANMVIQGISSIQLQAQGTLVGELMHRPKCWYFRDGHGLTAAGGSMVVDGDNRYHAILGNRGPAKFVSASRLAPALIAMGARVRILGPNPEDESIVDLADLYQAPKSSDESEHTLQAGQLVTHLMIPDQGNRLSAAYEVRHGAGPDAPLATAAVSLDVSLGLVRDAQIVLGQVAPTPWVAQRAAESLRGKPINENTATDAGIEAVAGAVALSQNEYKIQLAQVAVKRALLQAVGHETGGLDGPITNEPAETRSTETHLA
jgi:xanthine dehydrogenase YagS FAD-binding subunit